MSPTDLSPDSIADRLAQLSLRRLKADDDVRKAAVLVPFCVVDDDISVLFTKRSDKVGTHKGQVSFPGGMQDDDDDDDIDTALRELEEEILIPRQEVQVLGPHHHARAITGVHVRPIVGHLGVVQPDRVDYNPDEIDSVFTIAVRDLLHPDKRYMQTFDRGTLPVFDAGPFPVWGLTAYMLDALLRDLGLLQT